MTPLNEFRKLVPNADELTEEQLTTFRDLIDSQASAILDAFIAENTSPKPPNATNTP
jgi:hypothetical protein